MDRETLRYERDDHVSMFARRDSHSIGAGAFERAPGGYPHDETHGSRTGAGT